MHRDVDMIMLTCFGGVERTEGEFRQILKDADERYVLEAVKRPEGCVMAVITVGWISA